LHGWEKNGDGPLFFLILAVAVRRQNGAARKSGTDHDFRKHRPARCRWTRIYFLWRPNLRDEADNHLVELAVAGGAQAVVTRNKRDFRAAELKFENLAALTPAECLRRTTWQP